MSSELSLSKQLTSSTRTCCNCTGCRSCLPSGCTSVTCSTVLVIFFRLFIVTFLGVSIFLVIFFWSPLSNFFLNVLRELRDMDALYGALIVIGANVVAALMFLPCLPFTLATGFIFKTVRGTILICIASTIASILGFLIGRYLARGIVERNLGGKNSPLRVIDNAIQQDGFRVVFLIRLSPIHPFAVFNYLFGLTSVTLRDYSFASFFALLPATIMEVYSGAALSSIEDISRGDKSVVSSVLLGVGMLVTVAVSIIITLWVRQKLKTELDRYAPVSEDEAEVDVEDEEDVSGTRLERIDVSDESEVDREIPVSDAVSQQRDASPGVGHVYDVGGEQLYATEGAATATGVKLPEDETKEESRMPTASDLETEMSSLHDSPAMAPAVSATQRRIRQSPNNSPTRFAANAPSSSTALVHVTLRSPSFSSTTPSLPLAPLASPTSTSSTFLSRTHSSSSNSSGSSGGSSTSADDEQREEDKLIKHS